MIEKINNFEDLDDNDNIEFGNELTRKICDYYNLEDEYDRFSIPDSGGYIECNCDILELLDIAHDVDDVNKIINLINEDEE